HDDLLERTVPGALADPVDRALDLARASLDGGDRVGSRKPKVVVAVDADNSTISQSLDNAANDAGVFVGRRVADRIRDVDRTRSGGDHRLRDSFEEVRLGTGAVLGRELDIIDVPPGQLDGRHSFIKHLVLSLFELVLEMDRAGREEGMDTGPLSVFERRGRA